MLKVQKFRYYYDEANNSIPIRYAKVQLLDDDSGLATILAGTFTDEYGYYQFPPVENDDGIGQGGLDVYVKVFAEGRINGKDVDSIGMSSNPLVPTPPIISTYWSTTNIVPDIGGDTDMGSWAVIDEDKKGAWYIHDRIIDGYKYVKNTLAFEQSKVNINWWWTGSDKSFAQSTPDYYYFISIASDDEWDRDVITHEYSHTIQAKVYGLLDTIWPNPNCSPHYVWKPSSLTCAYDEGWATFLGVAINNYYDPSDTRYDDDSFYWNIESYLQRGHPLRPALENDADKTEGEVLGIFWDLKDPANEGDWDRINNNMTNVWDVFYNAKPDDINEFWTDWMARGHNYDQELWTIYYNHGINKDTTNPSTPSLISPSGTISDNTPTFTWSPSTDDLSGIDYYQIQVDDDISFGTPAIDTTTTSTSYPAPSALPDGTYYWHVLAVDNAGNIGGYSTTWSFTVDTSCYDTSPPPAPSSIAVPSSSSTGEYTVSWSSVVDNGCSGLSHYELQEQGPTGTRYINADSTSKGIVVGENGIYTYWVRAWDNAGNYGGWSPSKSITVNIPPPPPPPPPVPEWSLIDDFTSESGTAHDDAYCSGEGWGDWTYYDCLSVAEHSSYVTKVSTKGGRSDVGRFYFGNNPWDEAIQWLVKNNPSGWDFSYPANGKWIMYCYNENTAYSEGLILKFIDDGGLEATTSKNCESGTGWQVLEFDKPSSPGGFNWADVTEVKIEVDKASGAGFTTFRDMYFDDLGWEMDVYLDSTEFVVDPGESFTLTISGVNKYSDTYDMLFYVDGGLITPNENNPTQGGTYSRSTAKSHSTPGSYTHTGYIAYNRESDWTETSSNPVEIIVIDNIPPVVSITTPQEGANLNTQSVLVQWSGSDAGLGIDRYEVRLDTQSWINKGTATSHTYTGVTEGLHTVYVKAVDKADNTATDSVGFRVDLTAPPAPVPSATPSTWTSTNSFSVDWTNPSDASGIAGAYYKLDSLPTSDTGTWTTSKPITGITVSGDGSHPIYVWLKDGVGNVDYNNYGSTTLNYDGTVPDAPTNMIWEDGQYSTDTAITADWSDATDVSGIADYYLQVDVDSTDFTAGLIFDGYVGSSVSSKMLTSTDGVADGHTYYYRVKAKNGAGLASSAWSAVSAGVTVDTTLPTVTVLSPNGGEEWETGTQHTITWTATDISGVTSIDLYYSIDGGVTYPYTIANGVANDGTYTWTIPDTPTTTARVKVVASDVADNSGYDESDGNFVIKYTIPLNQYWNLISVSLEQSDWSITSVLSSIEGKYTVVFEYRDGGWKRYPAPRSQLTEMSPGYGYWVNATAAGSYEVTNSETTGAPASEAGSYDAISSGIMATEAAGESASGPNSSPPAMPTLLDLNLLDHRQMGSNIDTSRLLTIDYIDSGSNPQSINSVDNANVIFWGVYDGKSNLYTEVPAKDGTDITITIDGYESLTVTSDEGGYVSGDYNLHHHRYGGR